MLSAAIYIGPEGGYDIKEVALARDTGFPSVNLGRRILRCETASGFVLSCMTYAFEL
jgi:16S rRNA (uracil1498-N3)-methyltransferase